MNSNMKVVQKMAQLCKQHPRPVMAAAAAVGGYAVFRTIMLMCAVGKQISAQVNFKNLERDTVHLFIHHRWSHGPNYFPACLKVETFLRLAKIPYTVHFTSDASASPTGRLPFIVYNGTVIGDSEFIVQFLKEEFKVTMDDHLTPEEQAIGLITRRLAETSLNYGLQRTMLVDRPELMQDVFAKEYQLDPTMAQSLVHSMRGTLIKVLNTIGYGNVPQEQYPQEFLREVESLETLLSFKPFLLGSKPTSYDCAVYGWLHVAVEIGPHGPAMAYLSKSKTLREYVARVTKLAFPDIKELNTLDETQRFIPYKESASL
ncbi:hypothetical protein DQ04_00201060 [Trypanosoma grayi]|uniref:hypothetical protein n=1 Tax=Trypanosoma grayi TaxID=71804 RepID=UPI0004F40780|nr:hypothetical protein DQ04_00201060 [Trypanosoma grayi]KEG15053.1 hypothetical protein DQ04_00201060 [Trypanosoma grayi]